jgi:hypothetical protein
MRYKVSRITDEISPEVTLIQAASALDAAAETAEKMNDVEGLLQTAGMWIKLSSTIMDFASAFPTVEHEEKIGEPKMSVGFQPEEIILKERLL